MIYIAKFILKNIYQIFQYIILFVIVNIIHNNECIANNTTAEIYLFKQTPIAIDPHQEIKSTFHFPDLNLNPPNIAPVQKKYKTRRILPRAKLD